MKQVYSNVIFTGRNGHRRKPKCEKYDDILKICEGSLNQANENIELQLGRLNGTLHNVKDELSILISVMSEDFKRIARTDSLQPELSKMRNETDHDRMASEMLATFNTLLFLPKQEFYYDMDLTPAALSEIDNSFYDKITETRVRFETELKEVWSKVQTMRAWKSCMRESSLFPLTIMFYGK